MISQISPIILASQSPRRQELLKQMDLNFSVVLKEVDESYPAQLSPIEIPVFVAEKKAKAFDKVLSNELVITADTLVCVDHQILGKPQNKTQAADFLMQLSGKKHQVITGVALLKNNFFKSFYEITDVYFKNLTLAQIDHYLDQCQPLDKAGAYGIQEWIGAIGIEKIDGSYSNVMGLPTSALFDALIELKVLTEKSV